MKQTKYFAIYEKIRNEIRDGVYAPGEKLPSKRLCADRNGCSVITAENAYAMLESEGYICAIRRKGYFVTSMALLSARSERKETELKLLPSEPEERETGAERATWFRTVRHVLTEYGEKLFRKAPAAGCSALRNAIAQYLLRYRGMYARPERIVVGSGAEQLYAMAVKILGREKVFGIESPGYDQIEAVYRSEGVSVCRLKMGDDGIESRELKKNFDVLHVTPFHSFPSGVSTSAGKRRQYLTWAHESGNYLIEDDFDSEFYRPGRPMETIFSSDEDRAVIYLNTFSKSISPAVRIGYMILPSRLLMRYQEIYGGLSCSVPVMDQYILSEFISSGNFERHLNRIRREMIRQERKEDEK